MLVTKAKQLNKLKNNNRFVGIKPVMINTNISFNGENNILYCEENVKLVNTTIEFNGNNSIIFLNSSTKDYHLTVAINNNSTLYIGKNCYFNRDLHISLSEEKNCLIGNDCMFSFGIWLRTADPHLIYDVITKERINNSKSIYIGDHVWIGQNALLLKGTEIDSGSIVGAMSLVSGKKIPNNESWGGNPVKQIKKNVFWNKACTHRWTKEDTIRSQKYDKFIIKNENPNVDEFIYKYEEKECMNFNEIEEELKSREINDRLKYILENIVQDSKNRFVHIKDTIK